MIKYLRRKRKVLPVVIVAREEQSKIVWEQQLCRHQSRGRRNEGGDSGSRRCSRGSPAASGEATVPLQFMEVDGDAEIHLHVDVGKGSVNLWEACAGAGSWWGPPDLWRKKPVLGQVSC